MTLSAITKDLIPFNPSALLAEGYDEASVVEAMRGADAMGLYCPHCYRHIGKLLPVKFRNPKERRKHFYHVDKMGDGSECASYSKETERHLIAKAQLATFLERQNQLKGEVEVAQEVQLKDANDNRRPDVLVKYKVGAKEAHEIQISYINSDGLRTRTEALKRLGCDRVCWYLYGKNYNKENRQCLEQIGATCYLLEFDDEKAKWTLDPGYREKVKPQAQKNAVDRCTEKLSDRQWMQRLESQKQGQALRPKTDAKQEAEIAKREFLELAEWFYSCKNLPQTPFRIEPHRKCNDGFYVRFSSDVSETVASLRDRQGKPSPRYLTGALTADLKRLVAIVGGLS